MSPTCFLIDDDPDDRDIFCMALETADGSYNCITANNGLDALEKIKSDDSFVPDYIFIDLNMPYMSGKQCLKELKQIPRVAGIPVIIYTTSSYSVDIEDTKNLGALHFMVKPSSLIDLVNMLTSLLNKENLPFCLEN